jgi:hypothetical protein
MAAIAAREQTAIRLFLPIEPLLERRFIRRAAVSIFDFFMVFMVFLTSGPHHGKRGRRTVMRRSRREPAPAPRPNQECPQPIQTQNPQGARFTMVFTAATVCDIDHLARRGWGPVAEPHPPRVALTS